jgi:hypothetical protein
LLLHQANKLLIAAIDRLDLAMPGKAPRIARLSVSGGRRGRHPGWGRNRAAASRSLMAVGSGAKPGGSPRGYARGSVRRSVHPSLRRLRQPRRGGTPERRSPVSHDPRRNRRGVRCRAACRGQQTASWRPFLVRREACIGRGGERGTSPRCAAQMRLSCAKHKCENAQLYCYYCNLSNSRAEESIVPFADAKRPPDGVRRPLWVIVRCRSISWRRPSGRCALRRRRHA